MYTYNSEQPSANVFHSIFSQRRCSFRFVLLFSLFQGTCSASTLLNGGWNICQLSCSHGDLLISSLTCSLMMEVSTGRLKQIGQSQRKVGPYGGCFGLHDIDPNQAFIARPGFRIWCTDNKGEVSLSEKSW